MLPCPGGKPEAGVRVRETVADHDDVRQVPAGRKTVLRHLSAGRRRAFSEGRREAPRPALGCPWSARFPAGGGAIGRLVPEDAIGLIRYLREHAA